MGVPKGLNVDDPTTLGLFSNRKKFEPRREVVRKAKTKKMGRFFPESAFRRCFFFHRRTFLGCRLNDRGEEFGIIVFRHLKKS